MFHCALHEYRLNARIGPMSAGSIPTSTPSSIARACGLALGVGTQLLFLWTAYQLFLFLSGPSDRGHGFHPLRDVILALFFAWPHSVLLYPGVQKWLKAYVHPQLMGCVHCLVTCVSLLVLFPLWSVSQGGLWDMHGWSALLMQAGFYGSWLALLYSLWLSGMGYQTGLLPWLYWVRGVKSPRREMNRSGAFRLMRHPVYLSFLGLIWFTPHMTWDHVILTSVWTIYIYVGSYMKDRRLLHYIGQPYREYAQSVPGFPLIGFGVLGKMR